MKNTKKYPRFIVSESVAWKNQNIKYVKISFAGHKSIIVYLDGRKDGRKSEVAEWDEDVVDRVIKEEGYREISAQEAALL